MPTNSPVKNQGVDQAAETIDRPQQDMADAFSISTCIDFA